jgi:CHAT domain-containing protein
MQLRFLAGRALNRLGRYPEAVSYLEKAKSKKPIIITAIITSQLDPKVYGGSRVEAFGELAFAYERMGKIDDGIAAYDEMIVSREDIRAKMTKETHKISFMSKLDDLYDNIIRLLLQQGKVSKALEYAERSRSRALADLLAGKKLKAQKEGNRALLAKTMGLQEELSDLEDQVTDGSSKERSIKIGRKKKEIEDVVKDIEKEDSELLSLTAARALSAQKIQELLDQDTALVEYRVSRNGVTTWVITSDSIKAETVNIPIWVLAHKVIGLRQDLSHSGEQAEASDLSASEVWLEISPKRFKRGEEYSFRVYARNSLPLYLTIEAMTKHSPNRSMTTKDLIETRIPGGTKKRIYEFASKYEKLSAGAYQVVLKTDQGDISSNRQEVTVDPDGVISVRDSGHDKEKSHIASDIAQFREKSLYDILLKPVAALLDKKRIGIIPDGILHYLPFAALENKGRYLVEDYAHFYLPSATVYKFCKDKQRPFSGNILALGNPDLGDPRLDIPFALNEVKSIDSLYPDATLLVRDKATETAFKSMAPTHDVLHLASHGEFDAERPLNSALRLSPSGKNDGRLTANEIFDLELNATLVTLSACKSGMSRIRAGNETMGIPRAFIYAGAPSVVASQWNVNDEATASLMKELYRNLKGLDKAEALRTAQLELLKNPKSNKPYYWAAFYLIGDYR